MSRKLAGLERLTSERAKRKDVLRPCLLSAILIASIAIFGLSMLPING